MKEKVIENEILNLLRVAGVFVWKNQSVGVFDPVKKVYRKSRNPHHINGVSDILGVCDGRLLAVEVKSETGRLSEAQKLFLANITKEGAVGIVARSGREALEDLLKVFPNHEGIKRTLERL